MTVQGICSQLAVIQREIQGTSFDNSSVIARCSALQKQIRALPSSVNTAPAKTALGKIHATLLQHKLRDFRDRITRLETLAHHAENLSLLKKSLNAVVIVEKELATNSKFFSPAMASEFSLLSKRAQPLIARLKPVCESSKTAIIARVAKTIAFSGAAYLLARSFELNSLAQLVITGASLMAGWKLFYPTRVVVPREATVRIGAILIVS